MRGRRARRDQRSPNQRGKRGQRKINHRVKEAGADQEKNICSALHQQSLRETWRGKKGSSCLLSSADRQSRFLNGLWAEMDDTPRNWECMKGGAGQDRIHRQELKGWP